MDAIVSRYPGDASVIDVDVDNVRSGEVRVHIAAASVCGSERRVVAGSSRIAAYPLVLGHESAGIVTAVGEGVRALGVGSRVMVAPYSVCPPTGNQCSRCELGDTAGCVAPARRRARAALMADGTTRLSMFGEPLHAYLGIGGLAEEIIVAATQAFIVPTGLLAEHACLLGCGLLTGLGVIWNCAPPVFGGSVAVIGCGAVGLGAIQAARLDGAKTIIAVDRDDGALDAAAASGATHLIQVTGGADELADLVRAATGDVDLAVEAAGDSEAVIAGLACTREGGTTVSVGGAPIGSVLAVPADLLFHRRRLIGSVGGDIVPHRDVPRALDLGARGLLQLKPVVGDIVDLATAAAALGSNEAWPGRLVVQMREASW